MSSCGIVMLTVLLLDRTFTDLTQYISTIAVRTAHMVSSLLALRVWISR